MVMKRAVKRPARSAGGREKIRYFEERRQKDGKVVYVWNNKHAAKRGMQFEVLGEDYASAVARAIRLNQMWDSVRTQDDVKVGPAEGTVAWMMEKIERSEDHQAKGAGVQKEIGYAFRFIGESPMARQHLDALKGSDMRAFHRRVVEKKGVAYAQRIMKWFRFLLNEAVRERIITESPMAKMRVERPPARQEYWFEEEVTKLIETCVQEGYPSIGLAVRMAYDLGQRQGDVLRMTRGQYDGSCVTVTQGKTKAVVRVPALPELKQMFDTWPKDGVLWVMTEGYPPGPTRSAESRYPTPKERTRTPYNKYYFSHKVAEMIEKAGFPSKTFQDLRRSAVVRLAQAGCTIPQIASITGHSYARCEQILEVYLPRTSNLAQQAIARVLEMRRAEKKAG